MDPTTSTLPSSKSEAPPTSEAGARWGGKGLPASRRRLCFVLDSLNIGGTETQAVELARRLDPERYDVTLVCLRARGPLKDRLAGSDVRLLEFHPKGGMNSPGGIYQLLRFAVFLRRGRFEFLHAHDLWANLLGVTAAKIARVPVIVSSQRDLSHLEFYTGKGKRWLRILQKSSDAVVTNAKTIREGLIHEEGFEPAKVHVVYNGVDIDRFELAQPNPDLFGTDVGNGKVVVLVGNMHTEVKGHPTLIAAASKVVREFPETRFALVGDGAMKEIFKQKVRESGLGENVLFLGRRNDVPAILASSDIGVLPSKAEGLPNAVLEYLAAGLATVASAVGGNTEVLQNEKTGLLVSPDDPDSLAQAILKLLRDPALTKKIGMAGREFARQNFSFEAMIQQIDAMYSELLMARGVNA